MSSRELNRGSDGASGEWGPEAQRCSGDTGAQLSPDEKIVATVSAGLPITTDSSDQMMQDGAGRLWTSLGQSPGLQMAWRRLPVFRSDMERRSAIVSLCRLEVDSFQLRWE